jgi:hypothetical protein
MRWRFSMVAVLALSIVGCSQGDQGSADAPTSQGPPKLAVPTEDAAVALVRGTVERNRLTTLKAECLSFVHYPSDQRGYVVDVHEQHDAHCGGNPDVAPRLFTFEVDRASGRMQTDAADPAAGLFHPIQ